MCPEARAVAKLGNDAASLSRLICNLAKRMNEQRELEIKILQKQRNYEKDLKAESY